MKRSLTLLLVFALLASLCACGSKGPYRGIVYGMSYSEVEDIERLEGSHKREETEERLLYSDSIAGYKARIAYNFENNILTSFDIIVTYSDKFSDEFDGDPEGFFADFVKELDKLYGKHTKEDSTYYWKNDYEVIEGAISDVPIIYSISAKFTFNLTE